MASCHGIVLSDNRFSDIICKGKVKRQLVEPTLLTDLCNGCKCTSRLANVS